MSKLTVDLQSLLSWGRPWHATCRSMNGAMSKWIGRGFIAPVSQSRGTLRLTCERTLVYVWKIMCVVVAMMMLATQLAEARPLSGPYQVAMSKNPELCNYMAILINGDMSKIGVVRYSDHRVFNAIHWEIMSLPYPGLTESAYFDIKNNGRKSLVLRESSSLSGIDEESLFIYPGTLVPANVLVDVQKLPGSKVRMGTLKTTHNGVTESWQSFITLNELPKAFQEKYFSEQRRYFPYNKSPALPVMGPYFVLRPFVWKGTYYLSITEQGPPGLDRYPKWFLIAKYLHGEDIEHICYLDNPTIHVNY